MCCPNSFNHKQVQVPSRRGPGVINLLPGVRAHVNVFFASKNILQKQGKIFCTLIWAVVGGAEGTSVVGECNYLGLYCLGCVLMASYTES